MTRLILLPWMSDPLAKLQERSLGIHLMRNQNLAVSDQRSHKLPSGTNETSQRKKKNEVIQIYSVHKDLFIHVFFLQGPIKLLVLLRLVFIVHCKVKSREELNKVTALYQASAHLFSCIPVLMPNLTQNLQTTAQSTGKKKKIGKKKKGKEKYYHMIARQIMETQTNCVSFLSLQHAENNNTGRVHLTSASQWVVYLFPCRFQSQYSLLISTVGHSKRCVFQEFVSGANLLPLMRNLLLMLPFKRQSKPNCLQILVC